MTLIKSISGIRGTIGGKPGEGLTPLDIVKYSAAFATWIKQRNNNPKVVIGRDARPSGQALSQLVTQTLVMSGCDVIDLGLTTTPTVEIAVPDQQAGGGIILTASHNPIQWNALKLLNEEGEFISGEDGERLLKIAETEDFNFSAIEALGVVISREDYLDIHINKILELELVDRDLVASKKFKVVVDAVNSSGGIAIPKLLHALGVEEVKTLYCDPDGNFPHNPEPLPEHLGEISSLLKNGNYDLGIVVDPDVDRLALVCENGEFFGEEYTLVAIADYVLSITAGDTVSNLSSTQALGKITSRRGGTYHASAVGEVNVVSEMKKVGAVIGGEGNGGIIYPALHYGRDALVGVALFLTSLAKSEKKVSELRAGLPDFFISKNKIELTPDTDVDLILLKIKELYKSQKISTVDGIRIDFTKQSEWVHLRKSNTEPIIRIYAESDTIDKAKLLASGIISSIQELVAPKA